MIQVEKAGEVIEEALFRVFDDITAYSQQHDPARTRPSLTFDQVNNSVWIKLTKESQVSLQSTVFSSVTHALTIACHSKPPLLYLMLSCRLCKPLAVNEPVKAKPSLIFDPADDSVCIKLTKESQVVLQTQVLLLHSMFMVFFQIIVYSQKHDLA